MSSYVQTLPPLRAAFSKTPHAQALSAWTMHRMPNFGGDAN